jgi:CheY-like chemotaxis protein
MESGNNVLVVDDDGVALTLMRRYLGTMGVSVLVAEGGEAALDIIREQAGRVSLVLLDIAMPFMNGLQVCKAIRSDLQLADLPVVALTARVGPGVDAAISEAGINDVITKPFDPQLLRQVLAKYGVI